MTSGILTISSSLSTFFLCISLSTFFLSISHVYSCLSLYNFLPHLLFLYFQLLTHSINPSGKHQVFKIIFPNISLESVTSFLFLQLPLYSPFLSLCLLLFLSFHFHFHSSFLLSCQNETCHTCFLFFFGSGTAVKMHSFFFH
uniref:Uncharacterized protein n=1 Tax=Cacopsylla melanoneura TaxID=428564 RepID=A0A8D8QXN8_9HEMI